MGEFAIGQSPGRLEDLGLLRGKGRFVEDAAELIEIGYQALPAVVEGIDALGGDERHHRRAFPDGIDHLDMPASPERIWRAIRAAS